MATGYIDPNGVWQYGEDDVVSPWSDYMNLGQASVSAALSTKQYTVVNDAAARDVLFPVPATEPDRLTLQNRGITVLRRDRAGIEERYFATYNAVSNPYGRAVPGWYSTGPLHAEYTTPTQPAASGSPTGMSNPIITSARSSARAADLFTPGVGVITLRNAGMYLVDVDAQIAGSVGGRSFVEILVAATTRKRDSIVAGEDRGGVICTYLAAAGDQLKVQLLQTSGASLSFVTTIRLDYLGPIS